MPILFREYALLAESGWFDPDFYIAAYPDVAALNVDPLVHYLEQGAHELRNPCRRFDARGYAEQCRLRGEQVGNPLLHYLQNERPAPAAAMPDEVMQLHVESSWVDDAGTLHVLGWAVCLAPIVSVRISIDDTALGEAAYGLSRDDVGASRAQFPRSRHSGFELLADVSSYQGSEHAVTVRATASTGIFRELAVATRVPELRCAPAPNGEQRAVELFCDSLVLTTAGQLDLSGWAVAAAPTERLTVLLDGCEVGQAQIGIQRSDVGNHFPRLSHARQSGFQLRHNLRPIGEGEHLVALRLLAGGRETEALLPVLAIPGNGGLPAEISSPQIDRCRLSIDLPELVDGAVTAPIRGNLEIVGWALARDGLDCITVLIDGQRIKSASTGIRRRDVQQAFPDWEGAQTAGFSVLLPHRTLPLGAHTVCVTLADRAGATKTVAFRMVVEEAPELDGPWSLRQRITQAEIDLLAQPLVGQRRPEFAIVLPLGAVADPTLMRRTLRSLSLQAYEGWRVYIPTSNRSGAALRRALLDGFVEMADRVEFARGARALDRVLGSGEISHLLVLRPGDELGCDALLEFAVHAVTNPASGLLTCDERRFNAEAGKFETFFKPQWSPDLLLSMNYLGRAWCVRLEVLRRAAVQGAELMAPNTYDLVLRLTEHAGRVTHVTATLLQAIPFPKDATAARQALQTALARRGIAGKVSRGRAAGSYRVRRALADRGRVSIIIPTCAARGLIRTCIDTLREKTAYTNYEIVCIENIRPDQPEWKRWLRANADRVLETQEPFNWSRFNNLAAAAAGGEYLLFLNDDIEIVDAAWLNVLVEEAQRPEVGVVGPQLLYPDGRVQHAGMFLAGSGVTRHAFRYAAQDDPGYFGLALAQREVMAVTGACFMMRRTTFERLGGFDESHDVVNNDVDFCLRTWQGGLRTIYTPHSRLIHHELASRAEMADSYDKAAFESKWRAVFAGGDPFFHPRLAIDRDDYSNDWEPARVHCAGHPLFRPESIRRILVVKLDHIGDCVVALPAVRRLKQHFPRASIHVLTGRASKPVWDLEPAVDELIEFDFFHARSASGMIERSETDWAELTARLMPYRFDLAVDLRKHWETRSVLRCSGARHLAGFDMKGKFPWLDVTLEWSEDIALIAKRRHTSDELVDLIDAIGAAGRADRAVIARPPRPLSKSALARLPSFGEVFQKPVVCVHPAAGNEMKQWPPEYFSVLIDQLIELEDVHCIIVGGRGDEEVGTAVLGGVANRQSVWSTIGLVELADLPSLIARCALFVGNDSGPKHLAAGLGVPTVGIHSGVVDANEWGPKGARAVAIQRMMSCSPCYHVKLEDCPRNLSCLRGLLPADVVRLSRRLLAPRAKQTPFIN